jgi:SAM-dependent methyltransferase
MKIRPRPKTPTEMKACPMCAATNTHLAYSLEDFLIVRCLTCGHGTTIYHNKVNSQERFSGAQWIETRSMLERTQATMARRRYQDLAPFRPGRALLEIGCGTGEFLAITKAAGHTVSGLDLSADVVAHVANRYPDIEIHCGTLKSIDFPPGTFDVITALHVIEHVSDPVGLLREMAGLLRTGGLVYIRVPNLDCWYRRVLGRNWWDFCVAHEVHFTDLSLRLALTQAGLEVIDVRSAESDAEHSWWPVTPLLLRRGKILRSLSNKLQPTSTGSVAEESVLPDRKRAALKRQLLRIYMSYRRGASVILWPISRLQVARGGGPELVAVARKTSESAVG